MAIISAVSTTSQAKLIIYNIQSQPSDLLNEQPSVVFHIKRAFRKPLKARVRGAERRECRLPFQGLHQQ